MGDWDRRRDPELSQTARGHRRKDRRRWCRGKFGVEHERTYGQLRNHWTAGRPCGWWRWESDNQPPWPAWHHGGGTCCSFWQCAEQEYCARCGKVLRDLLGADCTRRWVTPSYIARTWR